MSSPTLFRRPLQRLGLAGIGSAVLFVGIASPAVAATGVVIPLEPTEVALSAVPVENFGVMDPMADPNAGLTPTAVAVQYGGTITVDLPAELDDSAVEAALVFADTGDTLPDPVYSSSLAPTDPNYLTISGEGTGSITIDLPADDPVAGDEATLYLEPLTSTLGPAFTFYDPLFYDLRFVPAGDAAAPAAKTVEPELVAFSQVPCEISSGTRCAFPTPVTAGSTVGLDLTSGSVLRELGITDLTGVQVGLAALDANGQPTGAATELTAQVNGSTTTFVVPAGTAAGSHGLVIAQQTATAGVSVVTVEITVVAEEAPAVVPPAAAPTTPAASAVVNAGLRSNTGVEAVETGSTGTVAIAAGAGMLVLAGVGGVAVARTRCRPAAEGGTCA
ncbi:hypothetical protein ACI79G_23880 [Geodermatophilus sp. SYSU D00779]